METHDVVCTLCDTAFQIGAFGEAECPGCGLLHIWGESYGPSDEAIKTALAPKLCKTCAFWDEQHCASPKFVYDSDVPDDGLAYYDFECYKAGFMTGPDFGCVHHEEKP